MTLVQRPAPEFSAEAILPDGSDCTVAVSDLRGRRAGAATFAATPDGIRAYAAARYAA